MTYRENYIIYMLAGNYNHFIIMNGVKRIFVFSILLFIIPNAVFAKDDRHLFQHSYILKNLVNGKNQYKQAESWMKTNTPKIY